MNIQSLLNAASELKQASMMTEKEEFLQQLRQFWSEKKGKTLSKIPCMGYKELDLFQLYTEVQRHGGFEQVLSRNGTWAKIWRKMSIFDASLTDASTRLKKNYERYLLDFEHFQFPKRKREIIEREKRHKSASNPTKDVTRDEAGRPIFPLLLGKGLVIHSLGTYKKNGGSPIGFRSSRSFWSIKNPQKITTYTSEIIEQDNRTIFVVTPSDDPENSIHGDSPSAAWKQIVGSVTQNKTIAVSGSLRFGLLHPTVKRLLSELPDFKESKKRKKQKENQLEEVDCLSSFSDSSIEGKKRRLFEFASENDVRVALSALQVLCAM